MLRRHVRPAENHTPFGDVTVSKPNLLSSALRMLKEHLHASIACRKGTQFQIITPNHVVCAENGITRCCIRPNTTRSLVPSHPVETLLRQAVDPRHPLRNPTHHLLVIENPQQTTDRRHHKSLQAHPLAIDKHTVTPTIDDSNDDRIY